MSLARVSDPSRRVTYGAVGGGAFMLILALLDQVTRGAVSLPALVPPFGASVVIVFFTPENPSGRPWNVMVGHLVSALVASSLLTCLPGAPTSVLAALAVCFSGLLMLATRSVHPPGGATALLAVIAERKLGFAMMLCPALVGAAALSATRMGLDLLLARLALPVPTREEGARDTAQPAQ